MESNDLLGTYDALIVRFVICATQHPQINLFYNKSIFIYIVVIIMLFLYNYIVRPTRIQQNFDTTVIEGIFLIFQKICQCRLQLFVEYKVK